MKVKLIVNQQDIENGFSSIDNYNPINLNKFPAIKEEVVDGDCKRLEKTLAINIYAEDLHLPSYVLKDIHTKVQELIEAQYSFLKEYTEDFALVASFLNRYSENNQIWSEEFHDRMKKYDAEMAEVIKFINNLGAGIDVDKIIVEFKSEKVPDALKLTNDALMKMWLTGFTLEFKKYLKKYKLGLEDRDTNKIQSEYYAPMLKAYFEMIYNEDLFQGFKSVNNALLFFGYLCEIAGAFVYDMDAYEDKVRKEEHRKTKPITENEIQKSEKKVQQAVSRERKKILTSRVSKICKIYHKYTGIDITQQTKIEELPELCSLREYVIWHHIKSKQILSVDYTSTATLVVDRYRYHKKLLDILLSK